MDSTVIAAIIGLVGVCLTSIVTFIVGIAAALIGKLPIERIFSRRERERNNIPEIMRTKWASEWYFEDGSLYVSENITFDKWTKDSKFIGYGEVRYDGKEYKYSIEGEIAPNRIVVLTYKAEKYPSQANIGMACLELSSSAEKLDGTWAGLASRTLPDNSIIHAIRSGSVKMQKTKDL